MRPFYPTPATFPERKRKLRQCPEKLRTIGKYLSFLIRFPPSNHSSLCMCVHKHTVGESCLFSSHANMHTRMHTPRTQSHLSAVWVGFSVLVSPINTATRTLSSPPLALSPRFGSHTRTVTHTPSPHPQNPPVTPDPGRSRFPCEHLPACVSGRVRA